MKLRKQSIYTLLEYLLACMLVLDINCVWMRKFKLGDDFFTYTTIAVLMAIIIVLKVRIKRSDIMPLMLFYVFITLSGAVHGIGLVSFIVIGLGISFSFLTVRHFCWTEQKFFEKIVTVVSILAGISLIFYFGGSILDVIPGRTVSSFYWGGDLNVNSYYDIYYESQGAIRLFNSTKFVRNCGVFCEAPMFGYLLAICFGYELLIAENKNKAKLLVLLITGITSTSSTCVVSMVASVFFYLIISLRDRRTNKYIRMLLLLLLPFICVVGIIVCYNILMAKMTIGSLSYGARMDDIMVSLKVFLSSPLWGCGVRYYDSISNQLSMINRTSYGMSSGLTVLLAQTGIALVIWPVIKLVRRKYSIHQYCFLMVFLILFMFTNIPYKCINIYVVYSVLMNSSNHNIVRD